MAMNMVGASLKVVAHGGWGTADTLSCVRNMASCLVFYIVLIKGPGHVMLDNLYER